MTLVPFTSSCTHSFVSFTSSCTQSAVKYVSVGQIGRGVVHTSQKEENGRSAKVHSLLRYRFIFGHSDNVYCSLSYIFPQT